jgi:hypothetical protein
MFPSAAISRCATLAAAPRLGLFTHRDSKKDSFAPFVPWHMRVAVQKNIDIFRRSVRRDMGSTGSGPHFA